MARILCWSGSCPQSAVKRHVASAPGIQRGIRAGGNGMRVDPFGDLGCVARFAISDVHRTEVEEFRRSLSCLRVVISGRRRKRRRGGFINFIAFIGRECRWYLAAGYGRVGSSRHTVLSEVNWRIRTVFRGWMSRALRFRRPARTAWRRSTRHWACAGQVR